MFYNIEVDTIAVLVAALGAFTAIFIWYTLFGNEWHYLTGIKKPSTPDKKKMLGGSIRTFLSVLVASYVMAVLFKLVGIEDRGAALQFVFVLWIGIAMPAYVLHIIWEDRPFGLGILDIGGIAAWMVAVGMILVSWPV